MVLLSYTAMNLTVGSHFLSIWETDYFHSGHWNTVVSISFFALYQIKPSAPTGSMAMPLSIKEEAQHAALFLCLHPFGLQSLSS